VKGGSLQRLIKSRSIYEGVVTDLGLASKLKQEGRTFSSGQALLYRPPEVWQGRGHSRASDAYQIGVMLFQSKLAAGSCIELRQRPGFAGWALHEVPGQGAARLTSSGRGSILARQLACWPT
jgi:serine/threonine protein kinase